MKIIDLLSILSPLDLYGVRENLSTGRQIYRIKLSRDDVYDLPNYVLSSEVIRMERKEIKGLQHIVFYIKEGERDNE